MAYTSARNTVVYCPRLKGTEGEMKKELIKFIT
jgi:hypothetical protein